MAKVTHVNGNFGMPCQSYPYTMAKVNKNNKIQNVISQFDLTYKSLKAKSGMSHHVNYLIIKVDPLITSWCLSAEIYIFLLKYYSMSTENKAIVIY